MARLGPLSRIPGPLMAQVKARLTFPNPAFLEAEKREFYTGNIPQEIRGYQVEADSLVIPRGFTGQLVGIMQGDRFPLQIDDRRRTLPEVDFTFRGELHDLQEEAVQALASRDFGTLSAATGSGKTIYGPGLHRYAAATCPSWSAIPRSLLSNGLTGSANSWESRPRRWGSSAAAK